MQFLNPLGLLLLGLIPVLLLLHSLKPKAKTVPITTLFLWNKARKEQPAGLRLHKLLKNLPLLFQILILLLSALALFQPVWLWNTQQFSNMILVLDTSASMKTETAGNSRFELAQEKALELINDLPPLSQALIIESGRIPKVKVRFTQNKPALRAAIESIQPTDTAGDLKKSVFLALSFFDSQRNDQIFVITDGAGEELSNISGLHQNITPLLVGEGSNNVGITKFSFRQELMEEGQQQILLELKNFSPTPKQVPLELKINNARLAQTTPTLQPHEKQLLFFPYDGQLSGIAQVRLGVTDDFATDNQAHTVLSPPKPIRVLLISQGNYFLERFLAAHPNFVVTKKNAVNQEAWPEWVETHDIVVMDRISPPRTDFGNFLLLDVVSPQLPLVSQGKIAPAQILDWDTTHPILENVDLHGTAVESPTLLEAPREWEPLVASRQSGLVYAHAQKGLRVVVFAFDLSQTNLPRKVAFPLLMNNAFRWLFPYKFEFSFLQGQAGAVYPIYLKKHLEAVRIQTPSGKEENYQPEASPFAYANTQEVGIYLAQQEQSNQFFAVNLLDETESNIAVPEAPVGDAQEALNLIGASAVAQYHLWLILFFIAAVLLMIEWYFWLRLR